MADLKNFVDAGHFSDSSLSLTPDNSLWLFRDAGTSDVCALTGKIRKQGRPSKEPFRNRRGFARV